VTADRSAADRYDAEFDLVVLGSGASGMTAALVATVEGASALVLESTRHVGGTSARSSGTLWIPPVGDDPAATYLDALVGAKGERCLRQVFLGAGPAMIACLEQHAGFAFRPYPIHPDYRQDLPGAATGQRPLEPPEFDGRLLGDEFARVGWPIPELMLFGGMMVTRGEAARLLRAGRSLDGTLLGARLVLRYLADRLRYPRGTRLVLGNALVARLYKSLLDRQVPVWCEARTERLIVEGGGVRGAVVRRAGEEIRVRARDAQGRTALVAATYGNRVEAARLLIAAGADVNAQDDIRNSAFLLAGARGYLEIVRMTLAAGADLKSTNRYGGTALIPACHYGHVETVRELLKTKIDVDHVNNLGWTALLEAVILGDGGPAHTEIVRLLVGAGANVKIADRQGVTPLEHARQRNYRAIVEILSRRPS
jgi:hypothetical protein